MPMPAMAGAPAAGASGPAPAVERSGRPQPPAEGRARRCRPPAPRATKLPADGAGAPGRTARERGQKAPRRAGPGGAGPPLAAPLPLGRVPGRLLPPLLQRLVGGSSAGRAASQHVYL